jgi:hypothetical protein
MPDNLTPRGFYEGLAGLALPDGRLGATGAAG